MQVQEHKYQVISTQNIQFLDSDLLSLILIEFQLKIFFLVTQISPHLESQIQANALLHQEKRSRVSKTTQSTSLISNYSVKISRIGFLRIQSHLHIQKLKNTLFLHHLNSMNCRSLIQLQKVFCSNNYAECHDLHTHLTD